MPKRTADPTSVSVVSLSDERVIGSIFREIANSTALHRQIFRQIAKSAKLQHMVLDALSHTAEAQKAILQELANNAQLKCKLIVRHEICDRNPNTSYG